MCPTGFLQIVPLRQTVPHLIFFVSKRKKQERAGTSDHPFESHVSCEERQKVFESSYLVKNVRILVNHNAGSIAHEIVFPHRSGDEFTTNELQLSFATNFEFYSTILEY